MKHKNDQSNAMVHGSKDRCMDVKCKRPRRLLAMLRRGTAALRIELDWEMEYYKDGRRGFVGNAR